MANRERSGRILIADDEANLRHALKLILEAHGYDVTCAEDGEAALEAVKAAAPDVVLLDVKMPKKGGYEVCQAIRADRSLDAVRIILISAQCRDLAEEKGKALGANGYVAKPFAASDILASIAAIEQADDGGAEHV